MNPLTATPSAPHSDVPLISIFSLVKDAKRTIRRCVESVLALQYPRFEFVVQDGASTDGTREILEEYATAHPGIIKLVSEKDAGCEDAFYRALRRCTGDLIGSCLADEALLPDACQWALKAFALHPQAGAVYGDLYLTDGDGNNPRPFRAPPEFSVRSYALHQMNPPFASCFFRRSALEDAGLQTRNWALKVGEYEFWVELGLVHEVKYVPGFVTQYAEYAGQRSARKDVLLEMLEHRLKYIQQLFERPGFAQRIGATLSQTIAGSYLITSEVLRDFGNYAEGASLLLKANQYTPSRDHNERLLAGYYRHGLALMQAGRPQDALACWEPLSSLGIQIPELAQLRQTLSTGATPTVSVIVLCHNYAASLETAVNSVLAQTYRGFEILILDDGSTDGSSEVARRIVDLNQGKVPMQLFRLEDVGPSAARRFGIEKARGRFVVPLDADDRIAPEFLAKTVPVLESDPRLGFAYVDPVYFGDRAARYQMPEYDFKRLCADNYVSYCSLVRRAAFDAVDGYDRENWGYYEDWDLWIRLGKAGWKGKHVPEPLFFYQQHFSSSLSYFALRLTPVYRAFVISRHPDLYTAETLAGARAVLAEMAPGWHTLPPLRSVAVVRQRLAQHPGNRHLNYFLALAQRKEGDAAGAVATLNELLRQHPNDTQARELLQEVRATLQTSEAAPTRGTESDPSKPDALIAEARHLFQEQKWQETAELCAQIVFSRPDDLENLFMFSHSLANLGALADSLEIARRLVHLKPEEGEYVRLVALLEQALAGSSPAEIPDDAGANGADATPAEPPQEAPEIRSAADPLHGRRILIYTDDPGEGGAAHYNHSLIEALLAAGAHVSCAQPRSESPLLSKQAALGVVHPWTGYNPVVEFTRSFVDEEDAARVLEEARPDLVFFSDCCALSHIAAKQAVSKRGLPFVVICHSEAAYLAERFPQCLPIVKEQLARARAVIAVSRSSLHVLERHFGLGQGKGQVIYSGCAEEYFAPVDPAVRASVRAKLAIPQDAVLCFTAARLDEGKAHALQVEAIRRLRDQGRLGRLYVAWAGDGQLRAKLEQSVQSLKLEDRIRLLGYRWDGADLMAAADLFVLTTRHEALPLCLMEAMARGVPVIATSVGGIPEELASTGVLLPDPNVDPEKTVAALMEALVALEASASQRQELGAAARDRAQTCFRRSRMTGATLDVLRRALDASRGAATPGEPMDPQSGPASSTDFFGPEEEAAIEKLTETFACHPADPAASDGLYELQQALMQFLVAADAGALQEQFEGSFGRVFRRVISSGYPAASFSADSSDQLGVLDEALASSIQSGRGLDVRLLLARMLCAPAHCGQAVQAPLESIPSWLVEDYLAYVLYAPAVFGAPGECEQFRLHLLGWVRQLVRRMQTHPGDPLTGVAASLFATKANYIPLYLSGENTRELSEGRAALIEFVLRKGNAALDVPLPRRPAQRKKIRVAYVNYHFGPQTETHVTLPTLQLDRDKFEICLFSCIQNPGPMEEYCRSFADSFTVLPEELSEQVKRIRDTAPDIAIIGTNVTAVTNQMTLIALHRLAPLQLASYCSPVTTGMRNIDGYLSGTWMDFPGIQDHFTERLLFCEGAPGCLDYHVEPAAKNQPPTRASLGLDEQEIVFINAASCFKILPELQNTWARILKEVPRSRLLLLPFNPNWSNQFPTKQFERSLHGIFDRHGLGADRLLLTESLPTRADVKALEKIADVYLDTAPFSGSISVIDPLEIGLPPVVWEGRTPRSRMAAALLRDLDLPELIVSDERAYIAQAVRLATDAAYRTGLRQKILHAIAKKPRFIHPPAYAETLGQVLKAELRRVQGTQNRSRGVAAGAGAAR